MTKTASGFKSNNLFSFVVLQDLNTHDVLGLPTTSHKSVLSYTWSIVAYRIIQLKGHGVPFFVSVPYRTTLPLFLSTFVSRLFRDQFLVYFDMTNAD